MDCTRPALQELMKSAAAESDYLSIGLLPKTIEDDPAKGKGLAMVVSGTLGSHGAQGVAVAKQVYQSLVEDKALINAKDVVNTETIMLFTVMLTEPGDPACEAAKVIAATKPTPPTDPYAAPPGYTQKRPQTPPKTIECDGKTNPLCGVIPGQGKAVTCTGDTPLSFTYVENSLDGSKNFTKGCKDYKACEKDWWQGTSDLNACTGFDPANFYQFPFRCTVCCVSGDCSLESKSLDTLNQEGVLYIGNG